jgi:hypothetical protein
MRKFSIFSILLPAAFLFLSVGPLGAAHASACTQNSDCGTSGQVCFQSVCTAVTACTPGAANTCPPGSTCNASNGQCSGGTGNSSTGTTGTGTTFASLVKNLVSIINTGVVPIIFGIAFVSFLWGVVQFFFIGGDEAEGQKKGREFVLWGLIAMVVLFSTWGLVNLLLTTFGLI